MRVPPLLLIRLTLSARSLLVQPRGVAAARSASWVRLVALVVVACLATAAIGVSGPPAKPSGLPAEVAQPRPTVDRYGDPLPDGAIARFGTVRFRHGGWLQSFAYSPDGKMIATGGFGSTMLWEAETGKPIASLVQRDSAPTTPGKPPQLVARRGEIIFGLAFSPDGKTHVAGGSRETNHNSGHFTFWDVSSPKVRGGTNESLYTHASNGEGTWVRQVTVSPDGKFAAIGNGSGLVQIVDIKTHAILQSANFEAFVSGLSYAPDGKTLAVAVNEKVHLLDPITGKKVAQFEPGDSQCVAFAKDGKSLWIMCAGGDDKQPGKIIRWGLQTATAIQTFATAPGASSALAISPDGKSLASGGPNRGPFLWDVGTGKAVELDTGRRQIGAWGLAFAPDGKTLAVAGSDGRVRVWDLASRRELHRYDEHTDRIWGLDLTPDGKQAATAGGDGTVRIWDMVTGQVVRSWTADEVTGVLRVGYTPDGRSLLTSGYGGHVKLWDVATGKETRQYRGEIKWSRTGAALSPDGRLVATPGDDGMSITLYEAATGRRGRVLSGHISYVTSLIFSPDSTRLISSADSHTGDDNKQINDGSVQVWDIATGSQLHKFEAESPIGGDAVSPDGRVVTSVFLNEDLTASLRFWDMATGKELVERRMKYLGTSAHAEVLGRPAFSPDGRYLAIAEQDCIRLVEVASGRVVQAFSGSAGFVAGLTLTPDGRRLVSAHDDGTALVWDLTPRPGAVASLAKLWDQLASDDATLARQAAWALAADPVPTVTMLGEKLKPVPKPAEKRTTASLIDDLAAPDFRARDAASRELARRVSVDAYAELTAALAKSPSPEGLKRLTNILEAAPGPWPKLDAEGLRQVRALAVLEAISTPEARRLMKALADGDPYALLTREARVASKRLGE